MDTNFFIALGVILLLDGVLMHGLTWMATSARFSKYRIRSSTTYELPPMRKFVNTNLNNLMSLLWFALFFYYLGDSTLTVGWPGFTTFLGEVLGVLLLYDFMYYFFHRIMHHRKLMKYVHRIHHCVRFPLANESIYLHPLETLVGLGLLMLAAVILGPISAISFLVIFAIHSMANIIVHSNLVFPHPAFKLFNFWVQKHDIHHHKVDHNFASLFPFWDQMFGTAR